MLTLFTHAHVNVAGRRGDRGDDDIGLILRGEELNRDKLDETRLPTGFDTSAIPTRIPVFSGTGKIVVVIFGPRAVISSPGGTGSPGGTLGVLQTTLGVLQTTSFRTSLGFFGGISGILHAMSDRFVGNTVAIFESGFGSFGTCFVRDVTVAVTGTSSSFGYFRGRPRFRFGMTTSEVLAEFMPAGSMSIVDGRAGPLLCVLAPALTLTESDPASFAELGEFVDGDVLNVADDDGGSAKTSSSVGV